MTVDTFRDGLLSLFQNNNGESVNKSIIRKIVDQLEGLIDSLSVDYLKFYGASILIVFDGKDAWRNEIDSNVRLFLIDFAHSRFEDGIGLDEDVIYGLHNVTMFLKS